MRFWLTGGKPHRQILHNLLLRRLAVLIDVLIHTFLINLFNVIVVILFSFTQKRPLFYRSITLIDSMPTLPPRTTSILPNSSFISFTTASFFVAVWTNSSSRLSFSVVDDLRLERLSDLEQLDFVSCAAVEYLDIQNLFHAHKHVGEVDDFDDLDHAVQLFLICSNVSSSLTVAIVIRDTVGSSVVPTVRLSRL